VFSDFKIVCNYFQERREYYRRAKPAVAKAMAGKKKAHPINQMSFEYVVEDISKL
jgi:hypothetical protein